MIPDLTSRPIQKPSPFSALTHGHLHWAWLKVGTLKLDLRALKCENPIFFLRILFYILESCHNYENPVGRKDTLNLTYLENVSLYNEVLKNCMYLFILL